MSWSSKAGKGGKPLGGVDWKKQYERSPFLSPLEKRLLKEQQEDSERLSDAEWAKGVLKKLRRGCDGGR